MTLSQILFFYIPLISGVYYYFKNKYKFTLIYFITIGLKSVGINVLNIPNLCAYEILGVLIFVYVFFNIIVYKRKNKIDNNGRILFIMAGFFIIHYLFGYDDNTRRHIYNYFLQIANFIYILIIVKNELEWKVIIKYYILSRVFILVYAYLVFIFPNIFQDADKSAFVMTDSIRIGSLSFAYVTFFAGLIFYTGIKKKIIMILSLLTLILSGGRTALIGSLACFIYYFYIREKKKSKRLIFLRFNILKIYLPILVILIFSGNYLINNSNLPRYLTRFHDILVDPVNAGGRRILYYTDSLEKIQENPFAFRKTKKLSSLKEGAKNRYEIAEAFAYSGSIHNGYISILYAYGIFGLLSILIIITSYYITSRKIYLKSETNHRYILFLLLLLLYDIIGNLSGGYYTTFISSPIIYSLLTIANVNRNILFTKNIKI